MNAGKSFTINPWIITLRYCHRSRCAALVVIATHRLAFWVNYVWTIANDSIIRGDNTGDCESFLNSSIQERWDRIQTVWNYEINFKVNLTCQHRETLSQSSLLARSGTLSNRNDNLWFELNDTEPVVVVRCMSKLLAERNTGLTCLTAHTMSQRDHLTEFILFLNFLSCRRPSFVYQRPSKIFHFSYEHIFLSFSLSYRITLQLIVLDACSVMMKSLWIDRTIVEQQHPIDMTIIMAVSMMCGTGIWVIWSTIMWWAVVTVPATRKNRLKSHRRAIASIFQPVALRHRHRRRASSHSFAGFGEIITSRRHVNASPI